MLVVYDGSIMKATTAITVSLDRDYTKALKIIRVNNVRLENLGFPY